MDFKELRTDLYRDSDLFTFLKKEYDMTFGQYLSISQQDRIKFKRELKLRNILE